MDINKHYTDIFRNVEKNQIVDALTILEGILKKSANPDLLSQFENHKETYRNLLKFTFKGIEDPERENVYKKLLSSILLLADRGIEEEQIKTSGARLYQIKRSYKLYPSNAQLSISEFTEAIVKKVDLSDNREIYNAGENIFVILWLTSQYHETLYTETKTLIQNEKTPVSIKSMVMSALLLGLLHSFDPKKFLLLIEGFKLEQNQVWQRAFAGIILGIFIYGKRIKYHIELNSAIRSIEFDPRTERNLELIALQLIRTKETEKIKNKLTEEIMPQVAKIQPRLMDKLNIQDIINDPESEDKNPNWQKIFEGQEELYKKLEELSKLQMEGSDVFINTFSMLKNFPFFNRYSSWFMPFNAEHPDMDISGKDELTPFFKAIEESVFLCNSDKYSFCLSLQNMPASQKDMLIGHFKNELEGMEEAFKDENIIDPKMKDQKIFTQYFQDLYRFIKLHPQKNEFLDVFDSGLDLYKSEILMNIFSSKKQLKNIGEFYFEKGFYNDALNIFKQFISEGENKYEIYQKIAFSFEKTGNIEEALNYYLKAELFDKNRFWNTKKIAYCYRVLNQYNKSLEYYLQLEKEDSENLNIQASIGQCYLNLKNYEEALKHFFKYEYLSPGNSNIVRPIAWCYYALGNFSDAKKYYNRLDVENLTSFDYINLGHLHWCQNQLEEALHYYNESIAADNYNWEHFQENFFLDKDLLLEHGINSADLPLLIDFLKINK